MFWRRKETPGHAPVEVVNIHIRFMKLEHKYALQALGELETSVTYPVYVDYSKNVEQLIAEGHYEEKRPMVNNRNFPSLRKETQWLPVKLVSFTEWAYRPWEFFNDLGLQPVDAQTLISLGNQYPNLQQKYLIGALGQPTGDFDKDIVTLFNDNGRPVIGNWPSLGQAPDGSQGFTLAVRPTWQEIRK